MRRGSGQLHANLGRGVKKLGSDAKIEYLEGRDHFNLYEGGLGDRIAKEMYLVARPKAAGK